MVYIYNSIQHNGDVSPERKNANKNKTMLAREPKTVCCVVHDVFISHPDSYLVVTKGSLIGDKSAGT